MSRLNTRINTGTFSKIYLFDFSEVFRTLGKNEDAFYFYPHEVKGFIESCVLASQRLDPVGSRKSSIYDDIVMARNEWDRKVENATFGGFSYNGVPGITDYDIDEAYYRGCIIDTQTTNILDVLQDLYGEYSIASYGLRWTGMKTLSMKVGF